MDFVIVLKYKASMTASYCSVFSYHDVLLYRDMGSGSREGIIRTHMRKCRNSLSWSFLSLYFSACAAMAQPMFAFKMSFAATTA